MQQREETWQALDTRIVIVTFERGPQVDTYARDMGLRWPLLQDDTRELYRAYGMLHGKTWDIWGPRTWWAYSKELLRGRMPRATAIDTDTGQLGGDVLVDPSGTIRLLHVGSGPADRPSMATLLAVRQA